MLPATLNSRRQQLCQIWLGDIGLYRAAYGLGGLGLALVGLLGDGLLDVASSTGGVFGWLTFGAIGASEIAFAWIIVVATWRSAKRDREGARRHGSTAVCLALAFVFVQLALTVGWIGWSGLVAMGLS